jgi:hypothetical protein
VNTAAGQLTTLGPYEFTAATGDESLRLVLSPCGSPELLASTRDIVNVANASSSAGGATLPPCGNAAGGSLGQVRARDIQKVGVEGSTSFALDPISQSELAGGQLAPREVTIVFHHM